MTTLALRPIYCCACSQKIGEQDGVRIVTLRRTEDRRTVRSEFTCTEAVIECHRIVSRGGRMVVCGTVNRVLIQADSTLPLDKTVLR